MTSNSDYSKEDRGDNNARDNNEDSPIIHIHHSHSSDQPHQAPALGQQQQTIPSECEEVLLLSSLSADSDNNDNDEDGGGAESGDLERRYGKCPKNPGHVTFIPVSEFTEEHLPEEYRTPDTMTMIRRKIDLTVCVRVPYTSLRRPDVFHDCHDEYPYANYKGNFKVIRYGSGCVTEVTKMDGRCPCHPCRDSGDPKEDGFWKIHVSTATHVVFDDSEAKRAQIKCFFDSDDKIGKTRVRTLYGLGLDGCYDPQALYETDFNQKVMCATHDEETAERLLSAGDFPSTIMNLDVSNFVHASPAFMISHPHGCSKRITIGRLLQLTVPVTYKPPCLEEFTLCHVPSDGQTTTTQKEVNPSMSEEEIISDSLRTAISANFPESGDGDRFDRIQRVNDRVYILNAGRDDNDAIPDMRVNVVSGKLDFSGLLKSFQHEDDDDDQSRVQPTHYEDTPAGYKANVPPRPGSKISPQGTGENTGVETKDTSQRADIMATASGDKDSTTVTFQHAVICANANATPAQEFKNAAATKVKENESPPGAYAIINPQSETCDASDNSDIEANTLAALNALISSNTSEEQATSDTDANTNTLTALNALTSSNTLEDQATSDIDANTLAALNALITSNTLEDETTYIDLYEPKFGNVPIYNKPEMFVRAFEYSSMMGLRPTSTTLEPGREILLPPRTTFTLPHNATFAVTYFKDDDGKFRFPKGTLLTSPDGSKDIPLPDGTKFDNPLYSPKHFNVSYSVDSCPACSGAPVYCDLTDGSFFFTHYGRKQGDNRSGVHTSFCGLTDFTTTTDLTDVWGEPET